MGSAVPGDFTTVSGLVTTVTTSLAVATPLPLTGFPVGGG
jgi:hypothetical protein